MLLINLANMVEQVNKYLKLTANILKGKDRYQFLKELKYKGMPAI